MREEHDCIEQARRLLIEMGTDDGVLKDIDARVKARVNDAAEFAQSSPEPDEKELWTDVLLEA